MMLVMTCHDNSQGNGQNQTKNGSLIHLQGIWWYQDIIYADCWGLGYVTGMAMLEEL